MTNPPQTHAGPQARHSQQHAWRRRSRTANGAYSSGMTPRFGSTKSFCTAEMMAARRNANCGMDCCPMKRPRMLSFTSSSGFTVKDQSMMRSWLKGTSWSLPRSVMPFRLTAARPHCVTRAIVALIRWCCTHACTCRAIMRTRARAQIGLMTFSQWGVQRRCGPAKCKCMINAHQQTCQRGALCQ
jgi:hypothetical protein